MTEGQIGWVAGIIDGEGSICIVKSRDSYRLTLAIAMCHKPTIQRLRSLLKVGSISHHVSKHAKHNDAWSWHVAGEEAICVIKQVLPHLFTKRPQADLAIEFSEKCFHDHQFGERTPIEKEILRSVLAEEMRELNQRGK